MTERGGGGGRKRGWPPWRQLFERGAVEAGRREAEGEREAARREADGEREAARREAAREVEAARRAAEGARQAAHAEAREERAKAEREVEAALREAVGARASAGREAEQARAEARREAHEARAEARRGAREVRAEEARAARESRWMDRMRRRERAREIARQFEENLLFEIEREWQRWMPSSGPARSDGEEGAGRSRDEGNREGRGDVEGAGSRGDGHGAQNGGERGDLEREAKRSRAGGGRGDGGRDYDYGARDHGDHGDHGELIGDEWDGPIWHRGRRFGGPRRPRFGRRAGPFPRPPWPRGRDEAQETQQWLAWMERVEHLRSAHDRHHRRDRFRRRPWVWWLHAKLRQKIFVWLGIAIAIGLFAGGYLGRSGGSRGWMVLVVFLISWVGSGVIAWRMTRPLMLVVDAARAIGAGKLDTRIAVRGSGEVAILGTAINDMATRISAQLAEQRQLLAAVSHELRTPLGHLRVLLETARERGLPAPLFEQLEREVLDLDDLVGKLLASSRLEFGQLERKPIQLGELVAEAALNAGVAVEAISAEGNCQAQVDPTLVRRAVANLLDNAARHGGGAVAARVRGGDGEVTVEIDDAGPGVPAERRADAFSAFVPSAAGGLGLGLALVQRIAAAHRGSAWIAERPGGGARVGFSVAREMAPSRGPEDVRERASEKAPDARED